MTLKSKEETILFKNQSKIKRRKFDCVTLDRGFSNNSNIKELDENKKRRCQMIGRYIRKKSEKERLWFKVQLLLQMLGYAALLIYHDGRDGEKAHMVSQQ